MYQLFMGHLPVGFSDRRGRYPVLVIGFEKYKSIRQQQLAEGDHRCMRRRWFSIISFLSRTQELQDSNNPSPIRRKNGQPCISSSPWYHTSFWPLFVRSSYCPPSRTKTSLHENPHPITNYCSLTHHLGSNQYSFVHSGGTYSFHRELLINLNSRQDAHLLWVFGVRSVLSNCLFGCTVPDNLHQDILLVLGIGIAFEVNCQGDSLEPGELANQQEAV